MTDLEHTVAELEQRLQASLAERDELLLQQAATAEILKVINSSPGNLAPVFEAILEKAILLCGASFGALTTYGVDDMDHVVAMRGVTAERTLSIAVTPLRPNPASQRRGDQTETARSK